MKKRAVFGVLLTMLVLTGCGSRQQNVPVPPKTSAADQLQSAPVMPSPIVDENHPDELSVGVTTQTETETVPMSQYMGQGYSIQIPETGWRLEQDMDDGIPEDRWENILRDDVELTVSRYTGMTAEAARAVFVADEEDYRFEDLLGGEWGDPLTGTEPDCDVLSFMSCEGADAVYIVSWQYPAKAAEKFSDLLRQMADTFEVTN